MTPAPRRRRPPRIAVYTKHLNAFLFCSISSLLPEAFLFCSAEHYYLFYGQITYMHISSLGYSILYSYTNRNGCLWDVKIVSTMKQQVSSNMFMERNTTLQTKIFQNIYLYFTLVYAVYYKL